MREKVAIIFLTKPNLDELACKYSILTLNLKQACFEFEFPEYFRKPPFHPQGSKKEDFFEEFEQIVNQLKKSSRVMSEGIRPKKSKPTLPLTTAEYFIGIIDKEIEGNLFWMDYKNMAIITTSDWHSIYSPPSVFEYIIHAISGALVKLVSYTKTSYQLTSHPETKGCLLDYTTNKLDDKVDITLGYICEQCSMKITDQLGREYTECFRTMCSRDWIGEVDVKGSLAYNLKIFYKVDLNKDTGFYKSQWKQLKDQFMELPKDVVYWFLITIFGALLLTR